MSKKKFQKVSKQYNLFSAVIAFIIWGGWAYFVNNQTNSYSGIVSGIIQGIASFTITLIMVYAVTWLFYRIQNKRLRVILPAVITVSFTGTCLILLHSLIHTPEILYTISPALSVAFIFCFFTAYKLQKNDLTKKTEQ